MNSTRTVERRVLIVLALLALASAGLVVTLAPALVRFRQFTLADLVQLVTPLLAIALVIERVLEVFLTSWRAPEVATLEGAALDEYRARTTRFAFLSGAAIGVVIAGLGVRVLGSFVDPAVFDALSGLQQRLFSTVDVLLTGALLGGGADGLHKLVRVFTTFMDSTAELAKGRGR